MYLLQDFERGLKHRLIGPLTKNNEVKLMDAACHLQMTILYGDSRQGQRQFL
jgi:hypothetical protein